jgi:signal transduction histidine kinase
VREQRASAARAAERATAEALARERLHIARELHDVVAHGMSLIAVKAQVANHVADARPEEARDALRVIEETSKSSLAELRRVLNVLRTPAAERTEGDAVELTPVPGMADLEALVTRVAAAGVAVELETHVSEELPAGVELLAYRVVQEALTNIVKHAAATRCTVVVKAGGGALHIEVCDDGPGGRPATERASTSPDRRGYGLLGARERVTLYGGTFSAQPCPDGGFAVTARVPYAALGAEHLRNPVQ